MLKKYNDYLEEKTINKEFLLDDDVENYSYDSSKNSIEEAFRILNKLLDKQRMYRKEIINTDKTNITELNLLFKKLETLDRQIIYYDSEFKRILKETT